MNARRTAFLAAALLVAASSCKKKAEAPAKEEAQVERKICADDIFTGARVYTVDESFGA
ncbi:MAG: hypothetical protein JRG91_09850, partial [Deltaproteobacteria bacterium]|nr:hypothetical protein [Deltaproteobacteria bacterium]